MKTSAIGCAILFLAATGCSRGYADAPERGELTVRRGTFIRDVTLSGELEAARGELLSVPPLPSWQTAIKWLAEDGAAVRKGDPVVELDNTALTADLDGKRQASMQAMQELQQRTAEWSADIEQKQLEVEKKKAELEKAKIDAAVPRELVSARSFEEKQTILRRATVDYEKAVDLLKARQTANEAERRNLVLRIETTEREIATAENAIDALVLRAPRDGTVVINEHPWEGRKMQVGDPVWVGFGIALLPDFDSIRVKAALADVDDGKINVGMPATITLDGYPDVQYSGRITAISAVAQESRRASLRRHFEVLVALDRLDPERMRPGFSARVVVRRDTRTDAVLAPRAAIDLSGSKPRVKRANGQMQDLEIGACNAHDCVILKGLEPGDRLAPLIDSGQKSERAADRRADAGERHA